MATGMVVTALVAVSLKKFRKAKADKVLAVA
jgi:PTS system fructose-specific IIC component